LGSRSITARESFKMAMALDTYQLNLASLLLICGTLFAAQGSTETSVKSKVDAEKEGKRQYVRAYQGSQWAFYVVYALVMGADWLQVRPPDSKQQTC
jgi:MFS transporter, MFS domain-containing protein family, molybdate-anion transporter